MSEAKAISSAEPESDPRIERTKTKVREAALAALAEQGYSAFSVEAVAARSGVAKSTIYRHWPNAAALIVDTMKALNQQPRVAREPALTGLSGRERIRAVLLHLCESMGGDSEVSRALPGLIEGASRDPELAALLHADNDRRRATLRRLVEEANDAGEVRPPVDPEYAALALVGTFLYRRIASPNPVQPGEVEVIMETVLGRGGE
jgi:TetR/AcrR family transcriptional regulator, regulator of autoinduction and epiphytic fitness